jgi:hypothetical protein
MLNSAIIAALSAQAASAGVIGEWDFASGWGNQSSGLIQPASAIPGLSLSYFPNTSLYQLPIAHGNRSPPPNPPQLQFATTGSFGNGNLGGGSSTVGMRVPDKRG